jgi:integration host factor subunit alpha
MVIDPDEVAAELRMTGRNKNGGVVTRAFLREAIYRNCTGLSRRQADEILEATFAEICDALARGETVKLRSFGAFSVRRKRARVGRNPKTGIEAPNGASGFDLLGLARACRAGQRRNDPSG